MADCSFLFETYTKEERKELDMKEKLEKIQKEGLAKIDATKTIEELQEECFK